MSSKPAIIDDYVTEKETTADPSGHYAKVRDLVERTHGAGAEAADEQTRLDSFQAAIADPLYMQVETLFGDRIITTRPHRVLAMQLERIGQFQLVKPANISERIKTHKEYVFEALVLRTGTGVHPDDVKAGDRVIVSQFAGSVWYDIVRGRESELWLFGSGDVLLKLVPEAEDTAPSELVIRHCLDALDAHRISHAGSSHDRTA